MMERIGWIVRVIFYSVWSTVWYAWRVVRKTFRYLKRHKKTRRIVEALLFAFVVLWASYTLAFGAPSNFPSPGMARIENGSTVEQAASMLKAKGFINSATLFEFFARVFHGNVVVAGEYAFNSPQNIFQVASRITGGDFELTPVKVRVEEGMSLSDIAALLAKNVPGFDAAEFSNLAAPKEGMLYPDTYFILPGEEPSLVVSAMVADFNSHIREVSLASAIGTFGKPLPLVLSMAAILEKEASNSQDRRIIAGILWHRLAIGMRLQVDSEPDTYKAAGLPTTPIGNPSADAIRAAVTPVTTSYLFYLSDSDGVTHYSTTFDQHQSKVVQYLDN